MARWELQTDELALKVWDRNLARFSDGSPFQTYAWGEYNRALGWQPCGWIAHSDAGEVVAMMLGLLRKYPLSVGLVWTVGDPVCTLSRKKPAQLPSNFLANGTGRLPAGCAGLATGPSGKEAASIARNR